MIEVVGQQMAVAILRKALRREPTPLEILHYQNQVWLRNLVMWQRDRESAYQQADKLVWE